MTTSALHSSWQFRVPELNWPRVSAYSGSLTFHVALALALLIPPVAMELRHAIDNDPIIVTLKPTAQPEPIVEPAPPTPPVKRKIAAAPPVPTITITKPEFVPTAPANTIAPPAEAALAAPSNAVPGDGVADTPPRSLAYGKRTAIAYPRTALQRREQGTVVLHVLVGVDGLVQQIDISKSSGSRELDNAARDAVRHWSFQPGTRAGVAYAAWALVPITFSLP